MAEAVWALLAVTAAGILALGFVLSRIRTLGHRVGSFECALRRRGRTAWSAGIAIYGADRLDWYRVLSFSPRPEHTWRRAALRVLDRASRLTAGRRTAVMELRCRHLDEEFTLAMSEQASAGLTSWLEAAPPSGRKSFGSV